MSCPANPDKNSPHKCAGCDNDVYDNNQPGSISLKFNSGDPALLYRGEGLEPIHKLGLHTSHELNSVLRRAEEFSNRLQRVEAALATERAQTLKYQTALAREEVALARLTERCGLLEKTQVALALASDEIERLKAAHATITSWGAHVAAQERIRDLEVLAAEEIDELRAALETEKAAHRRAIQAHDCAYGETSGIHCPPNSPCTTCRAERAKEALAAVAERGRDACLAIATDRKWYGATRIEDLDLAAIVKEKP